ncbi:MAG: cytochrome b/b6 domain-containing protein [Pseudomonadales bacterium]|jgi:cytochrome b subunit of formate dehydrogenase|nr:cytochrome b/b6 domain-containing protein [Pseudomonadales bacterium]MDP6469821.1 cytochrome b/b6 domain-containing protein [Pseudomonadales bacterium]MDP6827577.1 cytochrome b/b6 domain-containing protein [Pseudomonadales bacterium]MDP6971291.1 cytochrome b/b6 domain-containing protein [Pseudomonadales bacterium]|tara:strand:- start:140 stop:907 length:768 start_codon:yes stop_codon:yes gene_type:complete
MDITDIAQVKRDVWGREVLLGVSWDLLWLVVVAAFAVIIVHLIVVTVMKSDPRPSTGGARLERHASIDRWFHWITAISIFVLLITGVFPIIGIKFDWLTIHWIAGLVLTAAVLFHAVRALFWQNALAMWIAPKDLVEPFDADARPAKYSFAQKGMHLVMSVLVLAVVVTGVWLLFTIDTPWWERGNQISEATLGWLFVLHGLSTLGLVGFTALHMYFALRPEKRFYTRSMLTGWISEHEHVANHDPSRWAPDKSG